MTTSDFEFPTIQITGNSYRNKMDEAFDALLTLSNDSNRPPTVLDWMLQAYFDGSVTSLDVYNPGDQGQNNQEWVTLFPDLTLSNGGLATSSALSAIDTRLIAAETQLAPIASNLSTAKIINPVFRPAESSWTDVGFFDGSNVQTSGNFSTNSFTWTCPATGDYIYDYRVFLTRETGTYPLAGLSYEGFNPTEILFIYSPSKNETLVTSASKKLSFTQGQVIHPRIFTDNTTGRVEVVEFELNIYPAK